MTKKIAFITKNRTNPAYGGALVGAKKSGEKFEYAVHGMAPAKADDPIEQSALVREAIESRPAAIILLPAHETGLNDAIDDVASAGIPLLVVVSKPTSDKWITYVGSEHVQMAHSVARRLLDHIGGTGDIAVMDGHPGSIATPERHKGFFDAASERPGIKIVDCVTGDFQREPARLAALEVLRRQPKIDGMLAANDLMAIGIIDAFNETGRKFPIVSINGTPEAVAEIKKGTLLATAYFNTLAFGKISVEAAARHLRGERIPRQILLPADIIDRANSSTWDRSYEDRRVPSWEEALQHQSA